MAPLPISFVALLLSQENYTFTMTPFLIRIEKCQCCNKFDHNQIMLRK